ncbi:bifunctional biotin--[acetyl-CoA-carboxylase] ligase/biotin operon repressor BirA [Thiorhodococcus mannitoliphagus]|uniref:Bifunctional ligase/repressor BirA n=1 Tax=Thiorhodococcus mannitoliphagus TaxID=329406 RepID=A0A6P1DT99_9GAMM|nr:bifunctional biotin--[acetyl-CoA-carboxylase] ligase/biotin operon repressor BirA [Thiorhodococcus mannitoliphagus]NEX18904.1 bifunctional biotin--[acetyl-CoA-carboxylase] ligase/biotin operon repressor BirA [Thiorhodococcus mannitoliphagus]
MERNIALIELLADGAFHSGEAIAAHLGITRAAVWKALRKTTDELGLALESVRGRGYRLLTPLELLDAERLLGAMSDHGRHLVSRLELHRQIDSTNAFLMRAAAAGAPAGAVCIAEQQTAGRGRRGRSWQSPFGVNLYLSVLWRYPTGPGVLGGMSLAAGATLAEVLAAHGVQDIALKWPNDILWHRRKLAGLLLEVAGESQGPSHLVVGLGLNLSMRQSQAPDIDQPWVSLNEILDGAPLGRNRLAGALVEALVHALERYGREGLSPFLDPWRAFDPLAGEPVRVIFGDQVIEGRHAGISDEGALQLETSTGLRRFQAGEVSLRPIERPETPAL